VKRDTVTDTVVYLGSHYEARFEEGDLPEDLDDDCDVDIVDIMLVASRWGTSCDNPDPDNNPATNNYDPLYDLDGDCEITVADIMLVVARWRETCEQLVETVKYYTLGGRRVAMRRVPEDQPEALYYLFSDHLGSTHVTYRASDGFTESIRYYPYGGTRSGEVPTDRLFTGQRFDDTIGLYDYGARFYDPALGRFISADTVVPNPGNPQAFNRYAYVYNNPLRYIDPNGHFPWSLLLVLGALLLLPGDTGPYDVSPANMAVGDAALSITWEPYDWASTVMRCSQRECNVLDYMASCR
jgi:RHS repeat-associated protein